jgi:hypothetical protein
VLVNKYTVKEVLMGRGDYDADLLATFNDFCKAQNVQTGVISAIGAVKNIKLGYFCKEEKKYVQSAEHTDIAPLEIVHCAGNVSLKNGEPLCHLHIVVSDRQGTCWGGHLLQGVQIYALEFSIMVLDGPPLCRGVDEATRLPLWV